MKIAITGHTNGIGKALAKQYEKRGYEIVGLSRRTGDNIRNLTKCVDKIKDCDIFINNAQVGFSQTELLFEVFKIWKSVPNKKIINVSTILTLLPTALQDNLEMDQYRNQKIALEDAHHQLLGKMDWPKLILLKPGEVNTGDHSGPKAADPDEWAEAVVNIFESVEPKLEVVELSLGVNYHNE